jgi:ribosomal 50S subunit-associated protein YjgA (DUF615 family)
MNKVVKKNIIKSKNEIKKMIVEIEVEEEKIVKLSENNINRIEMYKKFMENIITEYHNICRKLYN